MPSAYAHHRFGAHILPLMPADVRGPVLRSRALFNTGLQGPDFLFFHHFIHQTPLYRLGSSYHQKSGRVFFSEACARLRKNPSEDAIAYLHGLLAHYCLDSVCHPFVYSMTDNTELSHSELETEFDRYLMTLDGIKKPHESNICRHIRLKQAQFSVVSQFYPEISPKNAAQCIRNMALAQQLLTIPHAHGAIVAFTQLAGGNTAGKVMTVGPNPKCNRLNGKLLDLYEKAMAKFPSLQEQMNRHIAYNEPFGDGFAANFDRD